MGLAKERNIAVNKEITKLKIPIRYIREFAKRKGLAKGKASWFIEKVTIDKNQNCYHKTLDLKEELVEEYKRHKEFWGK